MPSSVLKVYPRPKPHDGPDQKEEWKDFTNELRRMKELVDRVPQNKPNRLLDLACRRMTDKERDEFRRIGNELLVNFNLFSSLSILYSGQGTKFQWFIGGSNTIRPRNSILVSSKPDRRSHVCRKELLVY